MSKLTVEIVNNLVTEWYKKLDVHAPMVEIIPMLATDGVHMVFPEATLDGLAAFESWYQGVIRIFFDEVHKVKSVNTEIDSSGAQASVKIVVHWEASKWSPPARSSDRLKLDAYQTWTVAWSDVVNSPVITLYTVDELRYDEDSAKL